MTPEQQKLREAVAEELWQADSIRAAGTRRRIAWPDAGPAARDKWLPLADAAIAVVLNEAAKVAARYVIDKKELHPDIPFDRIDLEYRNAIHTGAQYIAFAIRDLSPTTSYLEDSDPQSD